MEEQPKKSQGKLESLNKKSTIPKRKRKRIVDSAVKKFIIHQRAIHPRLGKEKLAKLLKEEGIASISSSTVGRIINDLKKRGEIKEYAKLSLYARTGRLIERKPRKKDKEKTKEKKSITLKEKTISYR